MSKHKDQIKGGLADHKMPHDFDKKSLKQGTKVEMEHTNNKSVAQEIAMDHLVEDKKYYDKLKDIEKQDLIEISPDGKQEPIEGKEPLKKQPRGAKRILQHNPKDPVFNPGKYPPKARTDEEKAEYGRRVMSQIDPTLKDKWLKLKKHLDNSTSILNLQEEMQSPEPEQQAPEEQDRQMDGSNNLQEDELPNQDEQAEQEIVEALKAEGYSDEDIEFIIRGQQSDEESSPVQEEQGEEEQDHSESEQKIIEALKAEGYSDSEIGYIVHGHLAPEVSETDAAKADSIRTMSSIDADHAQQSAELEREMKMKQMELEHQHTQRMKDLEYQHAQMQSPDPETDKQHKQRMLDLEYEERLAQMPDGSEKEIQQQMAQMDLEQRRLELDKRRQEIEIELEFKKRELELKLKHAEEMAQKKLSSKNSDIVKKSDDVEDEEIQDDIEKKDIKDIPKISLSDDKKTLKYKSAANSLAVNRKPLKYLHPKKYTPSTVPEHVRVGNDRPVRIDYKNKVYTPYEQNPHGKVTVIGGIKKDENQESGNEQD